MPKSSRSQVEQSKLEAARRRAIRSLDDITEHENDGITANAIADPDAKPVDELFRRRIGRPPSPVKKVPVLLRLDPEVVDRFKAEGDGWQTRMNDALRKAAGIDN